MGLWMMTGNHVARMEKHQLDEHGIGLHISGHPHRCPTGDLFGRSPLLDSIMQAWN